MFLWWLSGSRLWLGRWRGAFFLRRWRWLLDYSGSRLDDGAPLGPHVDLLRRASRLGVRGDAHEDILALLQGAGIVLVEDLEGQLLPGL